VSRPALVVHGHFYQPPRLDPFTGTMPVDPTAAPARDWNERISADCYRPNAELGNLGAMSWNLGPTLAGWLQAGDPIAYQGFVDGDRGANGMAQPFHHSILPLASAADQLTEVRWGIRDFEVRFGRRPTGMWLPETAVDQATLRVLVDHGITHTVLAPWQVVGINGEELDTRRPVRVELGDGRSIMAVLYDGLLSAAVSFDPAATVDADWFVRDRLLPRLSQEPLPGEAPPLVVIATDGELYGHHQPQRNHFLARLVGRTAPRELPYATPTLAGAVERAMASGMPLGRLRDRTSWSCHHGIARWGASCECVPDGAWKGPLRSAFDRLAGGVDAGTEQLLRALPGQPDAWAARDSSVDLLLGLETGASFADRWLAPSAGATDRATFAAVMEAQRWRLAMFASCGWFWDEPARIETAGALRAAVRAARLMDSLAGTALERRLVEDLALVSADGIGLLDAALAAVGAVGPSRPA
jgi:Domain of unknown function (DUF3536)/Glycosyl hydrolase family 57